MTTPMHLHAIASLDRPIDEVVARLRTDAAPLAVTATRTAFEQTADLRTGFREAAAPRVDARTADDGMASVEVTWNDDTGRWPPAGRFPFALDPTSPWWHREEERTGWPTMTLQVVASPTATGTRLAVFSTRTPGVDLTTNRFDRQRRDRLARAAVEQFLAALRDLLAADRGSVAADREPALA